MAFGTEDFEKLLKESFAQREMKTGQLVKATVLEVDQEAVTVCAGLKSDAIIATEEFKNAQGEIDVKVGDEVDVVIDMLENGLGETILSREKAQRAASWAMLEAAYENNEPVDGLIVERVKGGFTVDLQAVKAFLPGSLVDVRPLRDPGELEGQICRLKLIKMDRRRSNIVVSRRAIIEEESGIDRDALMNSLVEGQAVKGLVKNITDYGAFIDLGGIDGLLHITDMAWKRVKHPSDQFKVGDEIDVKILKFDPEKRRVSLGVKQLGEDPWANIMEQFPKGARLSGKVTNLTDYGCFVEVAEGIEGLVHMSEMDWTNKNVHPGKIVQVGDEVNVVVLDLDQDRRRISLGIKQATENPWQEFANTHKKGDKISGKIRSITDFGVFIGLNGAIDGLVHLSDISWDLPGEEAIKNFKKGDEIETVILQIDYDRERISLGIKQLEKNPDADFMDQYPKGAMVKGKVKEILPKSAIIALEDEQVGHLHISEVSHDRVQDIRDYLQDGEEVEAKVIGFDRKNHVIQLTLKEEGQGQSNVQDEDMSSTTLGDLFKGKIGSDD
jgi:small subunit ribosomal protein S1